MKYIKSFDNFIVESTNIKYKKDISDEDNIGINAYLNNKKIGSVSMEIMYDSYGYEFDDVFDEDEFYELFTDDSIVKISHIVVDNEYKNSGVGSELMKRAMKLMKKEGYTQFYLNASPMGSDGLALDDLVAFYKKFGFEEILHQGGNVLMKCCD